MDVPGHTSQKLLLMAVMVTAVYAWHGSRICPKQWLPVGGDCSRRPEYCPPGTVCERSNHSYTCQPRTSASGPCEEGTLCIRQKYRPSPSTALCGGNFCGGVCENDVCKLSFVSRCKEEISDCENKTVCEDGMCSCPSTETGDAITITSPEFPGAYFKDDNATWDITVPDGKLFVIDFKVFSLTVEGNCEDTRDPPVCPYDYVQLSTASWVSERYCGAWCLSFWGRVDEVTVRFVTTVVGMCRGFKAKYYFVDP